MNHKELDVYIEKYINGEAIAFDEIYKETKKSVYLSIYSIIKDQSLIEDVMQDTYLKAINSIEYYKLGTNFKAWISRIARNTSLNLVKKRNKEDIIEVEANPHIYNDQLNSHPLLDIALKILDGYEKEIIIYRIVLGHKFKEIGNIMGLPLGTVFWIYKNAISKIKKEI